MKNRITQYAIDFLVLVMLFGFGIAGLSLGRQDTWLNICPFVYNAVLETKESVVVDLNNSRRVDNYVNSSTEEVLLKKYYSACTGSRLVIDDNLVLRVSDEQVTKEYRLSLFETLPSPHDNVSFVLQGDLETRYGKRDKYEGFLSSYSKLSSNDFIYIPSSLADTIKIDFSIDDDENVVTDDEKDGLLKFEIANRTDYENIINVNCKVGGIFQSESSLGKTIDSFGLLEGNNSSTAICSPYFLSSFPHSTSRLIVFMKYNSAFEKSNDMVKGFSSALQYAFGKTKVSPKCIASCSEETKTRLNSAFTQYSNNPVLKYNYLFTFAGVISYTGLFVFIVLKGKLFKSQSLFSLKWRFIIGGMGASFLTSVGVLKIIDLNLKASISILSIYGLYFSTVLFGVSILAMVFAFWRNHNETKKDLIYKLNVLINNYYSMKI